jgi:hypothetical protein
MTTETQGARRVLWPSVSSVLTLSFLELEQAIEEYQVMQNEVNRAAGHSATPQVQSKTRYPKSGGRMPPHSKAASPLLCVLRRK